MSNSFNVIYQLMKAHEKGGNFLTPTQIEGEGQQLQFDFDYAAFTSKKTDKVDFILPIPYFDAFYILPFHRINRSISNHLKDENGQKFWRINVIIDELTTHFYCDKEKMFGKEQGTGNIYFRHSGSEALFSWLDKNIPNWSDQVNVSAAWVNIFDVSSELLNKIGSNKRSVPFFNRVKFADVEEDASTLFDVLGVLFKTFLKRDKAKLLEWNQEYYEYGNNTYPNHAGFYEIMKKEEGDHNYRLFSDEYSFHANLTSVFPHVFLFGESREVDGVQYRFKGFLEKFNLQDQCFVHRYEYSAK